eukprot:GGOE01045866.1.p1 GENE.GGOE01045866.1~~GGOE01045866.1.p1  ORF type:complete len:659 (-),score=104.42 GGOE01045866.1:1160-3136(-)
MSEHSDEEERGQPPQNTKLFVGQIPTSMTEEHLKPIFDVFGTVVNIQIIRDRNTGAHKASAFVSYNTVSEAQIAIDNLHNLHVIPPMTNPLQVKFAHVTEPGAQQTASPPGIKLFVGSLPREMTKEEVKEIFFEFGVVEDLHIFTEKDTGLSKGAAFVYMSTQEEADAAILALHGKRTLPPMTRPLQVSYAEGELERLQAKLFVGTLPLSVTKTDLLEIFSPFGQILEVYLMKQSPQSKERCAFLRFVERRQAEAALGLNGQMPMKDCQQPIVVRFADTEKEKLRRRDQLPEAAPTAAPTPAVPQVQIQTQPQYASYAPQFAFAPAFTAGQLAHAIYQQPLGIQTGLTIAGYPTAYIQPLQPVIQQLPVQVQAPTLPVLPTQPAQQFQPRPTVSTQPATDQLANAAAVPRTPKQQYGPPGSNVFIFHLPQSFTEQDMRTLFQPYGNIISCCLFLDRQTGRSKCFGFVSYDSAESAQAAIQALNGYQVGNYRLKVQIKAGDLQQKPNTPGYGPTPASYAGAAVQVGHQPQALVTTPGYTSVQTDASYPYRAQQYLVQGTPMDLQQYAAQQQFVAQAAYIQQTAPALSVAATGQMTLTSLPMPLQQMPDMLPSTSQGNGMLASEPQATTSTSEASGEEKTGNEEWYASYGYRPMLEGDWM